MVLLFKKNQSILSGPVSIFLFLFSRVFIQKIVLVGHKWQVAKLPRLQVESSRIPEVAVLGNPLCRAEA